jgi:hypothetical protein
MRRGLCAGRFYFKRLCVRIHLSLQQISAESYGLRESRCEMFSMMSFSDVIGRVENHPLDVCATGLVPSLAKLEKDFGSIGDSPLSRGCMQKILPMKCPM